MSIKEKNRQRRPCVFLPMVSTVSVDFCITATSWRSLQASGFHSFWATDLKRKHTSGQDHTSCHNPAFSLYNITLSLSVFASLLPLSSPGAPSVYLLIRFCAGKPPVQGRQEDREMASGTQIRQKQTQTCRLTMSVILISLCFSLGRVQRMQMFTDVTKHPQCTGWRRLLYKNLPGWHSNHLYFLFK